MGDLRRVMKRTTVPSLRYRVVLVEGSIHDRGSDVEHQMHSSQRRPSHLRVAPIRQCGRHCTVTPATSAPSWCSVFAVVLPVWRDYGAPC